MGFGQAMLVAWMSLQPGTMAPLPLGVAPAEAGSILVVKSTTSMLTSNGNEDGAVARRPWENSGGAAWCEISMEEGFGSGMGWKADDQAVQMFILAHETGHCVDMSSYGKGEQAEYERESYADSFGACALSMEGMAKDARGLAAAREASLKGRRGRLQAFAIRKALSNPLCAAEGGKGSFAKAWSVANGIHEEMFRGPLALAGGVP